MDAKKKWLGQASSMKWAPALLQEALLGLVGLAATKVQRAAFAKV